MEIIELTSENIEQYLEGCLEVQEYLVSNPATIDADFFKQTAADQAGYFIAVVEEGRVLGLGLVSRLTDPARITGYVSNIVVHPDARGRGLFKVIMDDLEQYAFNEFHCTHIILTCSREPVQAMYEKRGYIQRDTRCYRLQK